MYEVFIVFVFIDVVGDVLCEYGVVCVLVLIVWVG